MGLWKDGAATAFGAVMCLGLASACAGHGDPNVPLATFVAVRQPTPLVDVESKNLSPKDELDALMLGQRGLGRATTAYRVAIPPFRANDPVAAWIGEAAAEVVALGALENDGVSVIERGQLDLLVGLHKTAKEDDNQPWTRSGRLLGAQTLVVGSVTKEGADTYHVVARAVRVQDGVIIGSATGSADTRSFDKLSRPLAADLLRDLRVDAQGAQVRPLSAEALALASKARVLQAQGQLEEAQPLFAQALAAPSSAWPLESDYVQLMESLGLTERAAEHAEAVLARMPRSAQVACPRARLVRQRNATEKTVNGARDAVRAAASCGDKSILAQALLHYASVMSLEHYPSARLAVDTAIRLAKESQNAQVICAAAFADTWYRAVQEGRWGADLPQQYERIASDCLAAGGTAEGTNYLLAAGGATYLPTQRLPLYERAVASGKRSGGLAYDSAELTLAGHLSSLGRLSESDEHVLGVMRARLAAIVRLFGALPPEEARLDDDLLRRAGLATRPTGTPRALDTEQGLEARAHRIAFAAALRRWAGSTRRSSVKQGEFYDEVASAIDPPADRPLTGESVDRSFSRRLEKAKAPLDTILQADKAPPRGSGARLSDAYNALFEWYFAIRDDKAKGDQQRLIVEAARKIARWVDRPRMHRSVLFLEASMAEAAGDLATAAKLDREGRRFAEDDPDWARSATWALRHEWKTDPAQAKASSDRYLQAAQRISPQSWLEALAYIEHQRNETGQGRWDESVRAFVDAATTLEKLGERESAAAAYQLAATKVNEGRHVDGSAEAVAFQKKRLAVLEPLGDPVRTGSAIADLIAARYQMFYHSYRGGGDAKLAADPEAGALVARLTSLATELAKSGRTRDAARIASRVHASAPGARELIAAAFPWMKTFEDSVEYAPLAAQLHIANATIARDDAQRRESFERAAELFLRAKDLYWYANTHRLMLQRPASERDLLDTFARCHKAVQRPTEDYLCYDGFSSLFTAYAPPIASKEPYRALLREGVALLPRVDEAYGTQAYTTDLRTWLSLLAIRAGDAEALAKLTREQKEYFTAKKPDPYALATHFSRVARAARAAGDHAAALAAYKEFEASRGFSSSWRADEYWRAARSAAAVGDKKAEESFSRLGREGAASSPENLWPYELVRLDEALAKKDLRRAESYLQKAEAAARRSLPPADREIVGRELTLKQASARALRGDLAGARAGAAETAKLGERIARGAAAGGEELPCLASYGAELLASFELAQGACAEGEAHKALAASLRAKCGSGCSLADEENHVCDSARFLRFRATNECKKPFPGTKDMLR